jgi:hypothetical protein
LSVCFDLWVFQLLLEQQHVLRDLFLYFVVVILLNALKGCSHIGPMIFVTYHLTRFDVIYR